MLVPLGTSTVAPGFGAFGALGCVALAAFGAAVDGSACAPVAGAGGWPAGGGAGVGGAGGRAGACLSSGCIGPSCPKTGSANDNAIAANTKQRIENRGFLILPSECRFPRDAVYRRLRCSEHKPSL